MPRRIVSVVGPGMAATHQEKEMAEAVGVMVARAQFALLTGGVARGVMDAASRGAKAVGGTVIAVLPHKLSNEDFPPTEHADFRIITTFGEGRNVINAFSCELMIVIGMCPGTASEVCFAIKAGIPVLMIGRHRMSYDFFIHVLGGDVRRYDKPGELLQNYLINKFKHRTL